ncbi:MAG TPA: NYN domain-containing protein [Vicinamibacterales bacterium]|nr:NYN domain-containing protein [Vicinamibacterales bacterium]
MPETRLKIAVFIDFDNIEIGVKSTLNAQFDIGVVLEALKERGEVVSKIAYGDWTRAGDYSRSLTQHATKLVQRNLTPGGDKNGADINLALDALETAFTHPHINAYVIVGGDSDFITLVEKLKQYDKQVFIVGGRAFTSQVMQRNCHEFIAYENLIGGRRQDRGRHGAAPVREGAIEQAMPLVRRALKVLIDREVTPQLGLLKSTLLQLDSTFSERNYGVSSFRDFAQKLAAAGFVTLREHGRNVLVELKENGHHHAPHAHEAHAPEPEAPAAEERTPERTHEQPQAPLRVADGIREVRRLFQSAQNPPRWPMYVRQVKQFLRGVDASFDERKFGFASLVDLLRACQREGLFRIDRDRQGVMRIFAGNVMQVPVEPMDVPEPAEVEETRASAPHAAEAESEVVDGDVVQEVEAAPPVMDADVQPRADAEREEDVNEEDAQPAEEPSAAKRPRRRRAASSGTAPRQRKASTKPRAPRKPKAATVEP